jgi:hypothetical protein
MAAEQIRVLERISMNTTERSIALLRVLHRIKLGETWKRSLDELCPTYEIIKSVAQPKTKTEVRELKIFYANAVPWKVKLAFINYALVPFDLVTDGVSINRRFQHCIDFIANADLPQTHMQRLLHVLALMDARSLVVRLCACFTMNHSFVSKIRKCFEFYENTLYDGADIDHGFPVLTTFPLIKFDTLGDFVDQYICPVPLVDNGSYLPFDVKTLGSVTNLQKHTLGDQWKSTQTQLSGSKGFILPNFRKSLSKPVVDDSDAEDENLLDFDGRNLVPKKPDIQVPIDVRANDSKVDQTVIDENNDVKVAEEVNDDAQEQPNPDENNDAQEQPNPGEGQEDEDSEPEEPTVGLFALAAEALVDLFKSKEKKEEEKEHREKKNKKSSKKKESGEVKKKKVPAASKKQPMVRAKAIKPAVFKDELESAADVILNGAEADRSKIDLSYAAIGPYGFSNNEFENVFLRGCSLASPSPVQGSRLSKYEYTQLGGKWGYIEHASVDSPDCLYMLMSPSTGKSSTATVFPVKSTVQKIESVPVPLDPNLAVPYEIILAARVLLNLNLPLCLESEVERFAYPVFTSPDPRIAIPDQLLVSAAEKNRWHKLAFNTEHGETILHATVDWSYVTETGASLVGDDWARTCYTRAFIAWRDLLNYAFVQEEAKRSVIVADDADIDQYASAANAQVVYIILNRDAINAGPPCLVVWEKNANRFILYNRLGTTSFDVFMKRLVAHTANLKKKHGFSLSLQQCLEREQTHTDQSTFTFDLDDPIQPMRYVHEIIQHAFFPANPFPWHASYDMVLRRNASAYMVNHTCLRLRPAKETAWLASDQLATEIPTWKAPVVASGVYDSQCECVVVSGSENNNDLDTQTLTEQVLITEDILSQSVPFFDKLQNTILFLVGPADKEVLVCLGTMLRSVMCLLTRSRYALIGDPSLLLQVRTRNVVVVEHLPAHGVYSNWCMILRECIHLVSLVRPKTCNPKLESTRSSVILITEESEPIVSCRPQFSLLKGIRSIPVRAVRVTEQMIWGLTLPSPVSKQATRCLFLSQCMQALLVAAAGNTQEVEYFLPAKTLDDYGYLRGSHPNLATNALANIADLINLCSSDALSDSNKRMSCWLGLKEPGALARHHPLREYLPSTNQSKLTNTELTLRWIYLATRWITLDRYLDTAELTAYSDYALSIAFMLLARFKQTNSSVVHFTKAELCENQHRFPDDTRSELLNDNVACFIWTNVSGLWIPDVYIFALDKDNAFNYVLNRFQTRNSEKELKQLTWKQEHFSEHSDAFVYKRLEHNKNSARLFDLNAVSQAHKWYSHDLCERDTYRVIYLATLASLCVESEEESKVYESLDVDISRTPSEYCLQTLLRIFAWNLLLPIDKSHGRASVGNLDFFKSTYINEYDKEEVSDPEAFDVTQIGDKQVALFMYGNHGPKTDLLKAVEKVMEKSDFWVGSTDTPVLNVYYITYSKLPQHPVFTLDHLSVAFSLLFRMQNAKGELCIPGFEMEVKKRAKTTITQIKPFSPWAKILNLLRMTNILPTLVNPRVFTTRMMLPAPEWTNSLFKFIRNNIAQ